MPPTDHDILIEIKNDVKHLVQALAEHVKKDDLIQGEIKKDLILHQKVIYGCIGVAVFIEFIFKVYK